MKGIKLLGEKGANSEMMDTPPSNPPHLRRAYSFLPNTLKITTIGTSINAIRRVPTTEASPKFPCSTWANTFTGNVRVRPEQRITVELNSRVIVAIVNSAPDRIAGIICGRVT